MSNKIFHMLVDPTTERFWKGNLPTFEDGGKTGTLSPYVKRWKPNLGSQAHAGSWVREQTAVDKLRRYEMLRVVRPDVPKLILRKYEMEPVLKGQTQITYDDNDELVHYTKLFFYHGAQAASDWDKLGVHYSPEHQFMARLSLGTNRLDRPKAVKHFPTALLRGSTIFLNEDDAVLLRLVAPKTALHRLSDIFSR
jgi:hypothetical protein